MQGAHVHLAWRVHNRLAYLALAESARRLESALTVTKVTSCRHVGGVGGRGVGGVPWNLKSTLTVTNVIGACLCPHSLRACRFSAPPGICTHSHESDIVSARGRRGRGGRGASIGIWNVHSQPKN